MQFVWYVKKEHLQSDIFVNAQRGNQKSFCGIYPFSCSWEGEY